MSNDRIVSVGFLTGKDLEMLGANFDRHFPVEYDGLFAELIGQLDNVAATPLENGVVIRASINRT